MEIRERFLLHSPIFSFVNQHVFFYIYLFSFFSPKNELKLIKSGGNNFLELISRAIFWGDFFSETNRCGQWSFVLHVETCCVTIIRNLSARHVCTSLVSKDR